MQITGAAATASSFTICRKCLVRRGPTTAFGRPNAVVGHARLVNVHTQHPFLLAYKKRCLIEQIPLHYYIRYQTNLLSHAPCPLTSQINSNVTISKTIIHTTVAKKTYALVSCLNPTDVLSHNDVKLFRGTQKRASNQTAAFS